MTTRRRRWDVLLSAALFLLLALLFVPECDDCYFIYWDFASWKDFLLVRPIPQEGEEQEQGGGEQYVHPTAGIWATCWG